MKFKRLISLTTVLCFLTFTFTPVLAQETEAEKEHRREQAVLVAVGLVALVGVWYMLDRMSKDNNLVEFSKELTLYKKHPVTFRFGVPSSNGSILDYNSIQKDLLSESFEQTRILEMKISW